MRISHKMIGNAMKQLVNDGKHGEIVMKQCETVMKQ